MEQGIYNDLVLLGSKKIVTKSGDLTLQSYGNVVVDKLFASSNISILDDK